VGALTVVAAVVGLAAAAGLLLILDGLRLRPVVRRAPPRSLRSDLGRRLVMAAALGGGLAVITRWPVAGLAGAALGWFSPELFGGKEARERATARTEGLAAWTEMLRDTISGAHGLEEAVITTAAVAPPAIKPEVTALALRLEQEPLTVSLRSFADELAHPTGDLVVAALTLAAAGSVGELAELLGTLAVAARDEAGMRLRVEASRARLRTAVRVIAGCTAATALGLVLLNRAYLHAYGDATGQVVLAAVAAAWGASLWMLTRMAEFIAPERFLAAATTAPADAS
jgi:tight adherence protein B